MGTHDDSDEQGKWLDVQINLKATMDYVMNIIKNVFLNMFFKN